MLIFAALALSGEEAIAELKIVATTQDLASIVREIGGDHVSVTSIARGYQDAHYLLAKPSYMVKMNRADLLVYQGLQLEIGWLPLLIRGARNPKIRIGQPGHLNVSSAIDPIEIRGIKIDRSLGDIHPLGNPHYQLDPENGILMANLIADRLTELDSENDSYFKNNLDHFVNKLEIKIKEWRKRLEKLRHKKIVTYHLTWSYFFNQFEIDYGGVIELRPGIQPTPKELAKLADKMKRQKTKLIIQANYYVTGFADILSQKTGAKLLVLPASVGGVPDAKDYIGLFEYLVSKFEKVIPAL